MNCILTLNSEPEAISHESDMISYVGFSTVPVKPGQLAAQTEL